MSSAEDKRKKIIADQAERERVTSTGPVRKAPKSNWAASAPIPSPFVTRPKPRD